MEVPGIEPGAFRMQSGRSTTEPHPRTSASDENVSIYLINFAWKILLIQLPIKQIILMRNKSIVLSLTNSQ